jgi:hypothetical protein
MARIVEATAYSAVLALSIGAGCSEDGQPNPGGGSTVAGAGGGGGGTGVTSGSGVSTSASSTTIASSGPGAGVGGSSYVCDPPAAPGSIYEMFAESLDINQIEPVAMCKYRGDVMLIVNTAAL